jgi:hypothetical protein
MKRKKFAMGGPTDYASSGSAGGTKDMSFGEAFKAARAVAKREGRDPDKEIFTWKGEKYTAERADSKKAQAEETGTRGGPSTRGGPRTPTVNVTAKRDELPGQRYRGEYGESREALSSLSPEQKKEALKAGVVGGASMIPLARAGMTGVKAAASLGRTGEVGVRGMTLAQRERDAAAAAKYAERMKKMKETAEARSRMSRGSTYKAGGSVSSASKRADGIAKKGKTRGKFV